MNIKHRYDPAALRTFAKGLLAAKAVDAVIAETVADVLVEGDLLGHSTHGLAQLSSYLGSLEKGTMRASGTYDVVSDFPAATTWDGLWLPGPWLTKLACDEASRRARTFGTGTVVIRRAHHIACLAAYLEPITSAGMVCIIQSSDPAVRAVAPHGGSRPVLTPNPIAVGIPTDGDPILIDVSMSIATVGMARRLIASGEKAPFPWLVDGKGEATDDPNVLDDDPQGSLMLLGGLESGHKGFALALMVEALTSGLGGHGRADRPENWGASVFVQVLDPDAFGGREAFIRETSFTVGECVAGPSRQDANPVRMPGSAGLRRKRTAIANGLVLASGIVDALTPWADRLGVPMPATLST
ncbi:Ldh family oxidoreductase (plasmid) [Azospirillum brasilense]|uniref:Ldh family oxidoreductase n=1 Tax=Azospirillum brasilense TaxID=192 RepID=A0A4D8QTY8_AZOBR|nr:MULTISPECIES: Ldh family oxidoreductase [Azospirillum]MDW7554529.1 Ldh family oxidoreductase [Azospirillum brasilense]MDW7593952.1 Ldh family oxidoreductase [Azospirillum brasilense]MDW7632054.1 Ldh family oxidoreductase [Azospirillum brasilense]MDX5950078.1 Ldh family oxidoreductase [Azospirillum brasilense]NUB23605.1 Ldh family oxidoreductase [Azospirillum brasilense]